MGNRGSSSGGRRRRREGHQPVPQPPRPPPPQPPIAGNQYVYAAATPLPSHYPNPNAPVFYQYPGYYPPPPVLSPYGQPYENWVGGQYPYGAVPAPTCVEHQKAVTIRNDVNLKKETLRVEPDEENPGKYLVAFTFDAIAPGSITVMFFAKETEDCNLTATRENMLTPVTLSFEQGLGQKFRQPSGTGVESSMFEDVDTGKDGIIEIYPLVVKAEACPVNSSEPDKSPAKNSQITLAVIEKEKGEYRARVLKQILWVNGRRYELQEIYGIGNAVDGDFDGNDSGKECVICLSEPRDTTVLPCRHMCMCSGCAKVLGCQTDKCPICRQQVERLLEIKVNDNGGAPQQSTADET